MAETVGGPGKTRAKFFKDDITGRDMVEITIIGDPSNWIGKVTPAHVEKFPREWESYRLGEKEVEVGGTPITEVPGVDRNIALALKLKGVRNAEELAALDDAAAQGLGMGYRTLAQTARLVLQAQQSAPKRGPGRPPKTDQPEATA